MIRITSKLAATLRSHACGATHQAYRSAEKGIADKKNKVSPGQQEAWHVAQLCASIGGIVQHWRNALTAEHPTLTLSMSSIFTHQKPYVQWPKLPTGDTKCELADLLIAVIDRRAPNNKGIAVLIQAKLSDHEYVILKKSEEKQFELLSKRPQFNLVKGSGPTQVNLQAYSPDSALVYGLASRHSYLLKPYCGCCQPEQWLIADSLKLMGALQSVQIVASETLSSVLVGLIQGSYGWEFDLPPHGQDWRHFESPQRDDWSMLINFLLEDTFKATMPTTYQRAAGQSTRGKEDPLYFEATTPKGSPMFLITDGFNQLSQIVMSTEIDFDVPKWRITDRGPDGEFKVNSEKPEDGAISTILIEIGMQG